MKPGTKVLLGLAGAAILVFGAYQGYLQVKYRMYGGYKKYMDETRGTQYEQGSLFQALPGGGNVPDMVLAAENEFLELYTDVESTNVAIYDKRTGFISYVCPPDADDDPFASSLNKSNLKSPLNIDFFNARRAAGRYNVYDFAIKEGQIQVERISSGIRYIYTVGDLNVTTGIIPLYIHEDRLDTLLDKVDNDGDRGQLSRAYIESNETPEGFLALSEAAKGFTTINRLIAILESIGYTEEDCVEDSLASGMEGAVRVSFDVPLEYRLDGDSLVVTVPAAQIAERGGAKIDKIQVARFFGAADTEEEGYILVPNGTGSLIHFNNDKSHTDEYFQFIYKQDVLESNFTVLGNTEAVRLPVFGIYKENGPNILAQVESGASFASIHASVAGISTSYNHAFTNFVIRGSGSMAMFGLTGNEADMPVVESNLYATDLTVRYSFLSDDYDGYSGMARYYREKLERDGILDGRTVQGDIPLYVDMIGAVTGTKFMFSVQYQGTIPMTTFGQAAEIVDILNEAGISNQVLNYQGWFNRGYYHDVADRINLIGKLGNKREFEELSAKMEAQGGKFYADVIFQNVPYTSKRYNWPMENSRFYGAGQIAYSADTVNPRNYMTWGLGYGERFIEFISPKFLPRYVEAFAKRIDSYDITGISLRDLGSQLHSDRRRKEFIDREQALSIVTAQLDIIAGLGKDVMISGGNLYSFPVADDLINIPLSHSDFFIVDDEVPFYQMVIHGYIPYAGNAVNHIDSYDLPTLILKMLETGASPHVTLTYEESSEMKYTGLNHFYSTYYQNWTDVAVELYNAVNPVLSRVSGSLIVRHEITPDGLRCVTYDNGVQIIVNYTDKALEYEGLTVSAQGFAVREGVA